MNPAFNATSNTCSFNAVRGVAVEGNRSHRSRPGEAKVGERAAVLGRVAAGIVLLFLVVSAVVSVVVSVRYGPVARQHAQVAVSSHTADRAPAGTSAL